jgi:putative transposase
MLGTAERRDRFLAILEEARQRYRFVVIGYVIMPEHFHLLMSEPEIGDPSVVMKVVKERFARKVHQEEPGANEPGSKPGSRPGSRPGVPHSFAGVPHSFAPFANEWDPHHKPKVWHKRFYDFNVWTEPKRIEKLKYIHRNPVRRGLVSEPDQWAWSSFRFYAYGEQGWVRVNYQEWPLTIGHRSRQIFGQSVDANLKQTPLIRAFLRMSGV